MVKEGHSSQHWRNFHSLTFSLLTENTLRFLKEKETSNSKMLLPGELVFPKAHRRFVFGTERDPREPGA